MSFSRRPFYVALAMPATHRAQSYAPSSVATNIKKTTLPMDIKRNGSQPSSKGPAEWFTGSLRVKPLYEAPVPAHARGASVTFEPGARTAWHTHPLGQTLIVTSGCGRVQRWGGPIEEIRPGDVVWFAPGGGSLALWSAIRAGLTLRSRLSFLTAFFLGFEERLFTV